jgi:hypothetical protein
MFKSACAAGIALLFATPILADPNLCRRGICPGVFSLSSVSDSKSYGLLLAAPKTGCRRVRYRVETWSRDLLGKTVPLAPGEIAVVRMGIGFAEGVHSLRITAEGCTAAPALTRRVTLRKTSPDHGWRASAEATGAGSGV